jgi:O-antigen/teichoic acid export membrane protein
MMIYTRTDSVMIERIHPNGKYEAGVYAQGFRLLDALFMFGMIFANLLLPIFSRMFKQNKTAIPEMLVSSRNLLVGGSILIAAVCFFNPDFILGLIYKNDVSASSQSFQWLMLSFIGMCLSLIYGTLLTAKGDMRFLNQLSIVGIVVNIAFNALLIPEYGAAGSAFATLVTQGFTALIQLFYAHSKLEIPFQFAQTLRFIGFSALLLALYFFIPENEYNIYLQLIAGTIGLFVFRLIDVKELKKQFSTEM